MMGSRARRNTSRGDDGGDDDHQNSGSSFFLVWVKALLLCACLCCVAAACFYLRPLVAPTMAELWWSAQSWCTAPLLFVLLNVVVGALYASSGMVFKRKKIERVAKGAEKDEEEEEEELEQEEERGRGDGEMPAQSSSRSGEGGRASHAKPRLRLPRSKSEQIFPAKGASVEGEKLTKSGTFEGHGMARTTTPRHRLVVVADLPEEAATPPPGSEEVDQKAEDFIGRFYHKVKLQRLDSLLRRQQQQQ